MPKSAPKSRNGLDPRGIRWFREFIKKQAQEGKTVLLSSHKIGIGKGCEDENETKAAIQAETKRIIAETGTTGLVIGEDCTIPSDIDEERIEWVREAAAE